MTHDSTSPRIAEFGKLDRFAPLKVAFISDLHLLSSRHDYARHAASVRGAVQRCDVCIWGGDLFDFHWSCEGDGAQSREIAIDWLQAWRNEFPQKCFVYLTGNHDASPAFQRDLTRWAGGPTTGRRLTMKPGATFAGLDGLRIADVLFVHGDGIESLPKMTGREVSLSAYRSRWQHERIGTTKPPTVRNHMYNAAVNARLHLAAAGIAHRRKSVCLRLLRWVREQPEWVSHDLKRIVFGHTHRRLNAHTVAGIQFDNGGAAVRHVPFEPVELSVQPYSRSG